MRCSEPGHRALVAIHASRVPGRRPRMVLLRERLGSAFRKLERLSFNRHEKIPCATRNRLARPTVAQTSEKLRPFALVADFTAVAPSSEYGFGCAHFLCLTTQAQRPGPRDAWIATRARWPGSLQRMVRPLVKVSQSKAHLPQSPIQTW